MHTQLAKNIHGLFVASGGNLSSSPTATAAIKAGKVLMAMLAIAGMGLNTLGCSPLSGYGSSSNGSSSYGSGSYGSSSNGSSSSRSAREEAEERGERARKQAVDSQIGVWRSQAGQAQAAQDYKRRQDEQSAFDKATPEQKLWYLQHR